MFLSLYIPTHTTKKPKQKTETKPKNPHQTKPQQQQKTSPTGKQAGFCSSQALSAALGQGLAHMTAYCRFYRLLYWTRLHYWPWEERCVACSLVFVGKHRQVPRAFFSLLDGNGFLFQGLEVLKQDTRGLIPKAFWGHFCSSTGELV